MYEVKRALVKDYYVSKYKSINVFLVLVISFPLFSYLKELHNAVILIPSLQAYHIYKYNFYDNKKKNGRENKAINCSKFSICFCN